MDRPPSQRLRRTLGTRAHGPAAHQRQARGPACCRGRGRGARRTVDELRRPPTRHARSRRVGHVSQPWLCAAGIDRRRCPRTSRSTISSTCSPITARTSTASSRCSRSSVGPTPIRKASRGLSRSSDCSRLDTWPTPGSSEAICVSAASTLQQLLAEWDEGQATADLMGYIGTRLLADRGEPGWYLILAEFAEVDGDLTPAAEAERNNRARRDRTLGPEVAFDRRRRTSVVSLRRALPHRHHREPAHRLRMHGAVAVSRRPARDPRSLRHPAARRPARRSDQRTDERRVSQLRRIPGLPRTPRATGRRHATVLVTTGSQPRCRNTIRRAIPTIPSRPRRRSSELARRPGRVPASLIAKEVHASAADESEKRTYG